MTDSPLRGLGGGRDAEERDLDAEMEAHVAHRIDDLVDAGVDPLEARRLATAEFGDRERIKARSLAIRQRARRQRWRASTLGAAARDLGFALRQLRRARGFSVAALATLMLGIGGFVTIASVVHSVVLAPLPFHDPDRVVFAGMLTPESERFAVSEATFVDWRRDVRAFDATAAIHTQSGVLRSPGQPRAIRVARVSSGLLRVLGLAPVLGRPIAPEEDRPGSAGAVALLSYAAWRADFGSDPDVLGSSLDIDGTRYEVIGVMPPDLRVLTDDTPIFVPLGPDPTVDRGDHYLDVVARLAPGVGLEEAAAELGQVQRRSSERHGVDLGWSTELRTARQVLIGPAAERAGWTLLLGAGLLLLMSCVNVSNLLLVRATVRRGEMALRAALGAGRARLVRQMFTESGLLALAGGVLGITLAALVLPIVRVTGAGRIPRLDAARIDAGAIVVGLAAIALTTLATGMAPAVQLRTGRLGRSIGSVRGGPGDPGRRLRSLLVGAQITMTVVLLAGSGLMLRSFLELTSVDPGFEPNRTLAFSVDMPDGSWSWEVRRELLPELRAGLASLPGVTAVGATAVEPFSGQALANFVAPAERIPDRASDFQPIQWRVVTPGFFRAMGMRLQAGRPFRDEDSWDDGTPVVIGEGLARRLWPNESAVEKRLVWGDPEGSRMTVVGVVEDLRDVELGVTPQPVVYRPHRQIPWAAMTMVVRVHDTGNELTAGALRARVAEIIPGLPIGPVASLRHNLRRATAEPRFHLQLLASFAILGLLIAVVGVYGLTAFDVRRRFGEIGIRLSLGARPEGVLALIVRQRLTVVIGGLAAGLVGAWALSRTMAPLLYGISPADPVTWLSVTAIVGGAALGATYLSARRATRVDPRDVLNAE